MNARIIKSIVTVNMLPNQVLFIRTQYTTPVIDCSYNDDINSLTTPAGT
jgi:hypothetical protein